MSRNKLDSQTCPLKKVTTYTQEYLTEEYNIKTKRELIILCTHHLPP